MLGRWWKFTSDQLHNVGKTQAQSAKTFKKGFRGFLYSSTTAVYRHPFVFVYFRHLGILFFARTTGLKDFF